MLRKKTFVFWSELSPWLAVPGDGIAVLMILLPDKMPFTRPAIQRMATEKFQDLTS